MADLAGVATTYGTPAYVYQLGEVRDAYQQLRGALPGEAVLFYSLKANPLPAITEELAALGAWAEVSSAGELGVALEAGVPADHILYTGPGKSAHEICHALERGVRRFSVDSPEQARAVASLGAGKSKGAELLLRVNPEFAAGAAGLLMGGGSASPFGADQAWIRQRADEFLPPTGATLAGFHFFVATNLESEAAVVAAFGACLDAARELSDALGIEPRWIDLGGGFASPYAASGARPVYANITPTIAGLLDKAFAGWRHGAPRIAFESGRYLVGSAGTLLSTVVDVKRSNGRTVVVLDTGIHHLGGMAGLRRLPRAVPSVLSVGGAGSPCVGPTDVVGPLCTPLDCFGRGLEMPRVAIGDVVAVPNVGAYGLTASLIGFLSRDCPTEVVLDGDEVRQASRLTLCRSDLL